MRKQLRQIAMIMSFVLMFTSIPMLQASAAQPDFINITSDWRGSVFGDVGGGDKITAANFGITENANGTVTLKSLNNNGKIAGGSEGIAYYFKELPDDANFELSATATVDSWDANNQVSFGIMARSNVLDNEHVGSSFTGEYVAVGALDQAMKGFYKMGGGTQQKAGLEFGTAAAPSAGNVYELKLKKSGDVIMLQIGSQTKVLSDYTGNLAYVGLYTSRKTQVTYSNVKFAVDTRAPSRLKLNTAGLKVDYFVSENLDLTNLVTAVYPDGHEEKLNPGDYIVSGFDNTTAGLKTITIHFNGATVSADVNVKPLNVTALGIKYFPAKTVYYPGDTFDPQGLTVLGQYNGNPVSEELANDQYTLSVSGATVAGTTYRFGTPGTKTVTVRSTVTTSTYTSFDISVKDAQLTGLDIRQSPEKMLYYIGEPFVVKGMIVYAQYSDGTQVRLMRNEYTVSQLDSGTPGTKTVEIIPNADPAKKTSLTVAVKQKELTGIQITHYPKTTYDTDGSAGEEFDPAGLAVSAVYDSGDKLLLMPDQYTVDASAFVPSVPGTYEIRIAPQLAGHALEPVGLKVTVRQKAEIQWKTIRFGQSSSDNNNKAEFLDNGAVRLTALEGGGKVTGDHDGIIYYYTELDAVHDNFELSADIKVTAYAKDPQDGQESFGLMARDAIGQAGDPSVFASNIAAVGGYSGGTTRPNGTQLFVRTGVEAPNGTGSKGIQSKMLNAERPTAANTSPAKPYRLTLAKTNSGFTGKLNNGTEEIFFEPDLLKVQNDKMYVGFYAARLATIEVSGARLTVTAAETDPPKMKAPEVPATPAFDFVSLTRTSQSAYQLSVKSNVNGAVTIKQGLNNALLQDRELEAGKTLSTATTVAANTYTNFSAVFVPDDTQNLTSYDKIVKNFTVDMRTYADNGDIYVSPGGTSTGDGSMAHPLDLDTAVDFVKPGQKIWLLGGTYSRTSKLDIKKSNDGTADAKKHLFAAPGARPVIDFNQKSEGVVLSGSYWHVKGIDFTRSAGNTKGFTVGGSHNIVEYSRFYANGDTGLQISSTDGSTDKSTWPSYNLILNCDSFDNIDPSNNNADGFAAKLTSGAGNVFRGDISHNNIDDGWDLYTKAGSGAIGAVIIENSIAFHNGTLTDGTVGAGDKNGFKLGGEGIHVPHLIRNSIAFGNGAVGFASNSNPGVQAENNVAFNNAKGNLNFTTYTGIATDFRIGGFVSYQKDFTAKDNYPAQLNSDQNYMFNGTASVNKSGVKLSDSNFVSLQPKLPYERDAEGNIIWGDFLKLISPGTDPEPNPGTNPGGKRHSSSSGGGGAGAVSGVSEPQHTSSGPLLSVEPQSTMVDGKKTALAVVDAASLNKAIEGMTDGAATITIEVKSAEPVTAVQIPALSVSEAVAKAANAILSVKVNDIVYDLPLKAIDLSSLSTALGAAAADIQVTITIEKVSGDAAAEIDTAAKKQGAVQLSGPLDFRITAEANGRKVWVLDLGNVYVSRSFDVSGSIDAHRATGAWYNSAKRMLTFVPSRFSSEGGATRIVMQRPGNSIYTVVQANKSFADMIGHWAREDVELLASKLLVDGSSDTAFTPQNPITRAEFAALLVRATGLAELHGMAFPDVAKEWFAGAVGAAAQAGLIVGFEDGTFRPDGAITREQMAVMIVRAMELAGKKADSDPRKLMAFEDNAQVSEWAKAGVAGAVNAGIVNGMTDKAFAPNGQATRAEAAVMLKRLLQAAGFMN
ncbi:S-layer homology domain-containing protein [Paenibacillus piri]|uniref:Exopolygalacturonate lyase n=1 Tax=Paenibacillus piri TaxID=2547395 RepID=A0A4R5KY70_9BACL|nr:S-layer homology domain-containing protein [Paenibacillus piri]TDG00533.1 exopolygalacturonate lyase [Paenibacillus piri]